MAIASYGVGVLYAAEVSGSEASAAEDLFRARLRHGGVKTESPHAERVVGTTSQGDVVGLVVAGQRVLILATSDMTLARAAEAYARRALRSPPALDGAALSMLPKPESDVIAAFYAPGPFADTWGGQSQSLLGSATAVAVTARGQTAERMNARVLLAGSWSAEGGDGSALEASWEALQGSETGRILGLGMAERPRVEVGPELLSLSTDLSTGLLLQGLYKLTSANVWEILDLPPPAPDASRGALPTQSASQPESAAISGP